MQLAFTEAYLAIGTSRPNPAVGAVLVKNGRIVGRGRTQKPGSHHAEIMALNEAGTEAEGADMYVTLEPCSHWGRTPPCADAILKAKVARVFIALIDENPRVNGGGVVRLRDGGILVEVGLCGDEATEFYRGFFYHMRTGLPWVDVKIAQSLDGFIAGPQGERTQITGAETGEWVHRLRARVDAIAIGGGTAVHDDPQLTVRSVPGNNPMRIILNGKSQLPASLLLFHDGEAATLVYSQVPQNALSAAEQQLWPSEVFADAWLALLKQLGDLGFHRILLESGARMAGLMLPDIRLWNRFLLITASKLLGRGLSWSRDLPDDWNHSLHLSRFERIDCDFLVEFDHVYRNNSSSRNHS